MERDFEQTLAFHCAPALAGIKPANMISCCVCAHPQLDMNVASLNSALNRCGVFFEELCRCDGRVLLLVYRRTVLERHLAGSRVRAYLRRAGYPEQSAEQMLEHLRERLKSSQTFPHELGVFLGYPVEDVEGFLKHQGRGCKLCGYWKVYGDADAARDLFSRYTRCRDRVCERVREGVSIEQMFRVA